VLPHDSLVHAKAVYGISFQTITIDVPVYLSYLLSRLLAAGASIARGTVQHIDQLAEGGAYPFTGARESPRPPDAIIICAGLGARTLGGVDDKDVFPMRGQTVTLRAPWVRIGRTISTKEGLWTYTIPRRHGDVCFAYGLSCMSSLDS
jgi:D-amino-acid oxidase